MSDDTVIIGDTTRFEGSGDTRQSTPVPASSPPILSADFARIIPVSHSAKRAFHRIASLKSTDQGWNAHHQKFLHVDQTTKPPSLGDENADLLTGHYRLNLTILPENFDRGWIIGSGQNSLSTKGVDLFLTDDGIRDEIRGQHARIFYHRFSRVLMLKAFRQKMVILNGEEVRQAGQMLSSVRMGLVVGNLTYRIEFLETNHATYREQLDILMFEGGYHSSACPDSFDPTPSANHFELRGYQFQTPRAAGSYGTVSACLQTSTGNLYAVKRIQRTRKLLRPIQDELDILEILGKHVSSQASRGTGLTELTRQSNVCSSVDIIYSDGNRTQMGFRDINDVFIILTPFAPMTFRDVVSTGKGSKEFLTVALHQIVQGIEYVHSRGIIHRDIKLENLLVASRDPLHAVVADFGHATTERGSMDHMKGTVSYLAPEILTLKNRTSNATKTTRQRGWTTACDVFSLGLVGLELFHRPYDRKRADVRYNVPTGLVNTLRRYGSVVDKLLVQMVSIDAGDRPSMKQILSRGDVWPEPAKHNSNPRKRAHELDFG